MNRRPPRSTLFPYPALFRSIYEKLPGMTATALTEAAEFQKIYGLGVVPIPTHEPMIRTDERDLIYRTEEAKFEAIVADVAERHEKGQPVLIGTASVAKSEILSDRKSTRLNSSHANISYAVFCLKKK